MEPKKRRKKIKNERLEKNAAVYYVNQRRRALKENRKFTFAESRVLYKKLFKEWKSLAVKEKELHHTNWSRLQQRHNQYMANRAEIAEYNTVCTPLFAAFVP